MAENKGPRRVLIAYRNGGEKDLQEVKDAYMANNFFNVYFMDGDRLMVSLDTIESVYFYNDEKGAENGRAQDVYKEDNGQ